MTAYFVANFTVDDPEAYQRYVEAAGVGMDGFGLERLSVDYHSEPLEGSPGRVTAIFQFPSKEAARGWYESAEYQSRLALRLDTTTGIAFICDGGVHH